MPRNAMCLGLEIYPSKDFITGIIAPSMARILEPTIEYFKR